MLGAAATEHLHLVEHDYTSFAGGGSLVATMVDTLGGVDDVVDVVAAVGRLGDGLLDCSGGRMGDGRAYAVVDEVVAAVAHRRVWLLLRSQRLGRRGGIIIHGLEEYGLGGIAHAVHGAAEAVGRAAPGVAGFLEWTVTAAASGVLGLLVGAALIPFVEHVAAPAFKRLRGSGPGSASAVQQGGKHVG